MKRHLTLEDKAISRIKYLFSNPSLEKRAEIINDIDLIDFLARHNYFKILDIRSAIPYLVSQL